MALTNKDVSDIATDLAHAQYALEEARAIPLLADRGPALKKMSGLLFEARSRASVAGDFRVDLLDELLALGDQLIELVDLGIAANENRFVAWAPALVSKIQAQIMRLSSYENLPDVSPRATLDFSKWGGVIPSTLPDRRDKRELTPTEKIQAARDAAESQAKIEVERAQKAAEAELAKRLEQQAKDEAAGSAPSKTPLIVGGAVGALAGGFAAHSFTAKGDANMNAKMGAGALAGAILGALAAKFFQKDETPKASP